MIVPGVVYGGAPDDPPPVVVIRASAAGDLAFILFGGVFPVTTAFIFGRGATIRRRLVCSPWQDHNVNRRPRGDRSRSFRGGAPDDPPPVMVWLLSIGSLFFKCV